MKLNKEDIQHICTLTQYTFCFNIPNDMGGLSNISVKASTKDQAIAKVLEGDYFLCYKTDANNKIVNDWYSFSSPK